MCVCGVGRKGEGGGLVRAMRPNDVNGMDW